MSTLVEKVKSLISGRSGRRKPTEKSISVRSGLGHQTKTLENVLWYLGETSSLLDYYMGIADTDVNLGNRFYKAAIDDKDIRIAHSGLPKLIADKLAGITINDLMEPVLNPEAQAIWNELDNFIKLRALLFDATIDVLVQGDGAFRIWFDKDIADIPIVEFFPASDVAYTYVKGILTDVIFSEIVKEGDKDFVLKITYSKGHIKHSLWAYSGDDLKSVSMRETAITRGLSDIDLSTVSPDLANVMFAIPYMIKDSKQFTGRGESIYHGKYDAFDGIDEVISTLLDANRDGRPRLYIPDALVYKDPVTGLDKKPSKFGKYTKKGDQTAEGVENKIEVVQPDIKFDGYIASYATLLDIALQGVISPSTLGIDLKKLDNATSQREKEKATLFTRDTIVGALEEVVPDLITLILYVNDIIDGNPIGTYEVQVSFGQYANPSFETLLDTVGVARERNIMSIKQSLKELYPNWSQEERDKEEEEIRKDMPNSTTASGPQPKRVAGFISN